jgi:hypothetical protein
LKRIPAIFYEAGEALKSKFLIGCEPFKGSRRKETDRVLAAKEFFGYLFCDQKSNKKDL